MSEEIKDVGTKPKKASAKSDLQRQKEQFIQNKLIALSTHSGARYQRDADRVVQSNTEVR